MEADSLYTADLTRTIPVSGTFTPVQRKVYEAVLAAADAGFEVVKPGIRFRDIHQAAVTVLAEHLDAWGLLPVPLEEALSPEGQHHRRWMPHGTSHHLGLDVHDCAQAKRDLYLDGILEPGMVFTIEPGLYFKNEDLAVPEEYRGIGIRIEDDVLVTEDGAENLSTSLPAPRTPWKRGSLACRAELARYGRPARRVGLPETNPRSPTAVPASCGCCPDGARSFAPARPELICRANPHCRACQHPITGHRSVAGRRRAGGGVPDSGPACGWLWVWFCDCGWC